MGNAKKTRSSAGVAWQLWGDSLSDLPGRQKGEKEKLPVRRNFCFLLLEKEPKNKLPVANSPPEFPGDSDT